MAVSFYSVLPFNPTQVTRSYIGSSVTKSSHVSLPLLLTKSKKTIQPNRRISHVLATDSDRVESITAPERLSSDSEIPPSVGPTSSAELPNIITSSDDPKTTEKKAPLTARERLRAARVLSRYSDPKPVKKDMGRSVLDALRESEKGKKGLPQAPTNMLDDQKRGMPKAGLTFDFPGGSDLLVIVFSFVFISTVMFATTYFVWKVGAIHFNEN